MLSPSASSSAVVIPTPGKSILKRPPPPQQSFFSLARLSKLLPTQTQQPNASADEANTLKRAHFILPEMTMVYPISALNPPSTPSLKEEKRSIEEREVERRKRVVRGNSCSDHAGLDEWWSLDKVESFYRECCTGREEVPEPSISAAFKRAAAGNPRTLDLSGVQLNIGSAGVLSDVFTIEWGLRKLVFKECDLDEHILKPMLHSLLIPGTLVFLSVASNKRLKAPAFRLLGAYLSKAKSLQFLDLSQNPLDKKSIEYLTTALPAAPAPGLVSLRLDDCSLKPTALDALAHVVRVSSLRNISLRHNRISATGAVAVALMIKDYPDRVSGVGMDGLSTPNSPITPSPVVSPPSTPVLPTRSLTLPGANGILPPPVRAGPLPPPPRHPSTTPQTTYTPYIPRAKRGAPNGTPAPSSVNPLYASGRPVPIIASSAQGGVTARHPAPPPLVTSNDHRGLQPPPHRQGPSAALLEQVRALDNLPRLGDLRTLDLKGNDIRTGITYIAQVLKRNRTLKVLNLSENKLDVQGLISVAEALKYNSCLETLDLSKNPCCGPGLEGIQSLRTAFTLNNALKRLFLSSTGMNSAGAIALAEFLPESTSLLHLDLTMNNLDLAGVMALSSGLKSNHTMRCLDLNIPPGDEELARMCRDILESCVRNTEEAEKAANGSPDGTSGRGQGKGVWNMIEESELAKTFRQGDKKKVHDDIDVLPLALRNLADFPSPEQTESDLVAQAHARKQQLEQLLPSDPVLAADSELVTSTREMMKALVSMIQKTADPQRLDSLLTLNDDLMALLARSEAQPESSLGLAIVTSNGTALGNGHAPQDANGEVSDPEDDEPITPRVDKGKGRAEPEPERHESVLSPTYVISESDDEDGGQAIDEEIVTPTDLSKMLVEEEGEVFRKGNALLGPEEMEVEYDSEALRQELLEAMVERPPPRVVDDFGVEAGLVAPDQVPLPNSPQEQKLPPRPYIRRSRSSSTISTESQSAATPTIEKIQNGSGSGSGNSSPLASPSLLTGTRPFFSSRARSSGSISREPSQ